MGRFFISAGTECISPEGTKYNSPGLGRASAAKQAAALGSVCERMFGRARSFAIKRRAIEADTRPRLDFVLGRAPSNDNVNRSDDGDADFLTQGSRLGLPYFVPSGQPWGTHWLFSPLKFR